MSVLSPPSNEGVRRSDDTGVEKAGGPDETGDEGSTETAGRIETNQRPQRFSAEGKSRTHIPMKKRMTSRPWYEVTVPASPEGMAPTIRMPAIVYRGPKRSHRGPMTKRRIRVCRAKGGTARQYKLITEGRGEARVDSRRRERRCSSYRSGTA